MSQIIIKKPYIEKKDNTSYLHSKFLINHEEKDIFFSVDSRYEKYLVDDRADSFIVSILTYAMKNNLDIVSEAPISKELLYSIVNYFIPMTSSNMEKFNKIKIIANPTNKKIISEGAVCTGFTGGVDSMYTLMTHLNRHEKNFNLTHLLVFNNGALEKNR